MRKYTVYLLIFFSITLTCLANASFNLKDRIPETDKRYNSFNLAFQLIKERDAKILVETGTARHGDSNCAGDGCSTVLFGHWAFENRAILYSVDICDKNLFRAKKGARRFRNFIRFIQSDSIPFLENFPKQIDFLYLDSVDFDDSNPELSQIHHLQEIIAAYSKLTPKSIIMIDDCDLPHGGKGKLVIDYLTARGWKIIYQGYQVILTL